MTAPCTPAYSPVPLVGVPACERVRPEPGKPRKVGTSEVGVIAVEVLATGRMLA